MKQNKDNIKKVENRYARRYPNLKQTKKSGLKYEVIEQLKNKSAYFSYDDIKSLLEKEEIEITASSLKSYVFELIKEKIIFDAGKGWYSSIEKQFELNREPVKEIIKTISKKFPLLSFSCWSTEQLNSFTHHILSKFITFVYTDSDYIRNTAEALMDVGYSVYENPTKSEIAKFFKINEKTIVLRPSITKQPDNSENYAPIEKILIDFLMENRDFKIMEETEAEKVTEKARISGRINMSAMFSYSKRRKFRMPNAINQVQLNKKGGNS